jgi:hypothetical protein
MTRVAFALVTAASVPATFVPGARPMQILLPVLVLQLFATSTGFIADARRGHFDVLLTGGVDRVTVAATYWALAVWPGVACWVVLALIDLAGHGRTGLLSAGTIAAVTSVSTIPWATTVPLNRFAGAIGWLLTLVLLSGVTTLNEAMFVRRIDQAPWSRVVACVLFPARLVGEPAAGNETGIFLLALLATIGMGAALLWISRTDVALETGQ